MQREDGLMPEDTITYRDLFDTKIMSMLVPRPSEVIKKKIPGTLADQSKGSNRLFLQIKQGYKLHS